MPASQHELYERGLYGAIVYASLDIAASLAAGWSATPARGRMCLRPDQLRFLKALPEPVRAAVQACERPNSRYLPPALKMALAVGLPPPGATEAERLAHLRRMLPKAAAAAEVGDTTAEREARYFRVYRPQNVPDAGRIREEIAKLAGVSVRVLEKWEATVRQAVVRQAVARCPNLRVRREPGQR
jgi:hypothetical protein